MINKVLIFTLVSLSIHTPQGFAQFGRSMDELRVEYGKPLEQQDLKNGSTLVRFKNANFFYFFNLLDGKSEGVEIQKVDQKKISFGDTDRFLEKFGGEAPWDVENKELDQVIYEQSQGGSKARLNGFEKNSKVLSSLLIVSKKYRDWEKAGTNP